MEMSQEIKFYAMRKLLENIVISALVFSAMLHLFSWHAYFILGGIVAFILAYKQLKQFNIWWYPVVAAMDVAFWPAMVVVNIVKGFAKAK